MSEPNEETWIPLTDITTITIGLPGGGSITIHNDLDSDDGVASVTVLPGKDQEATHCLSSGGEVLVVYGPHEGEYGHYLPDGSQDEEGMRYENP